MTKKKKEKKELTVCKNRKWEVGTGSEERNLASVFRKPEIYVFSYYYVFF